MSFVTEKIILLMLAVVGGLFDSTSSQCLTLTNIGGKNYYVHDSSMLNWFEADHFCRRHSMQLLTINSQLEHDHIVSYIRSKATLNGTQPSNSVWTSGTDYAKQGTWVWMSTGQPISFLDWAPASPDNYLGVQHSILLWAPQDYQMNDDQYSVERFFFCEETTAGTSKKCGCRECC